VLVAAAGTAMYMGNKYLLYRPTKAARIAHNEVLSGYMRASIDRVSH